MDRLPRPGAQFFEMEYELSRRSWQLRWAMPNFPATESDCRYVHVVPAQAGTHNHRLWNMGSRLRGNDSASRTFPSSHDAGEKDLTSRVVIAKRKRRRVDPERIGQPELARREKRRGRRLRKKRP
jgi:hypothetical protein